MSMDKYPTSFLAFLQAVVLVSYVYLVGLVINTSERWFVEEPGVLNIIFALTLLVVSVLVSGVVTLGYPLYLILKKKAYSKGFWLISLTIGWLVILLFFLVLFLSSSQINRPLPCGLNP